MPVVAAAQRLSPKVRRLLDDHDLEARAIAGTGRGGRVTPHDVLGAAGVPRRSSGDGVLASPLARRLLREAGVELSAAARANDGGPITRAAAERLVGELSAARDADGSVTAPPGGEVATTEVEADVARLLAAMAAVDSGFIAHDGFALTVEVAVASAVAALLVQRPELAGRTVPPTEDGGGGRTYPSIHVGFVRPDAQDASVAVVPDVQYLTVAGLARRARTAMEAAGRDAPATAPTVVVAPDAATPSVGTAASGLGLLTVSTPAPRRVSGVDELGHEVVRTRPHATLRLHHDARTPHETARTFLDQLGAAVSSWMLPVGP